MELFLGVRYIMRNGSITDPLTPSPNKNFPFTDPRSGCSYLSNGKRFAGVTEHSHQTDLVAEYVSGLPEDDSGKVELTSPKNALNFWEARQAALTGKKVRRGGNPSIFNAKAFTESFLWGTGDLDAEWEIIEEPKRFKKYVNVYPVGIGEFTDSEEDSQCLEDDERVGIIEIIADSTGKLLSAKNV